MSSTSLQFSGHCNEGTAAKGGTTPEFPCKFQASSASSLDLVEKLSCSSLSPLSVRHKNELPMSLLEDYMAELQTKGSFVKYHVNCRQTYKIVLESSFLVSFLVCDIEQLNFIKKNNSKKNPQKTNNPQKI